LDCSGGAECSRRKRKRQSRWATAECAHYPETTSEVRDRLDALRAPAHSRMRSWPGRNAELVGHPEATTIGLPGPLGRGVGLLDPQWNDRKLGGPFEPLVEKALHRSGAVRFFFRGVRGKHTRHTRAPLHPEGLLSVRCGGRDLAGSGNRSAANTMRTVPRARHIRCTMGVYAQGLPYAQHLQCTLHETNVPAGRDALRFARQHCRFPFQQSPKRT